MSLPVDTMLKMLLEVEESGVRFHIDLEPDAESFTMSDMMRGHQTK
jgi:hypothetical protein